MEDKFIIDEIEGVDSQIGNALGDVLSLMKIRAEKIIRVIRKT